MSSVTILEQPTPAARPSDKFYNMLTNAAGNESVSVEKMTALYDLYERMRKDEAVQLFNEAFCRMQPELPVVAKRGEASFIDKDGNHNQRKFAKGEDIVKITRPILHKHGFVINFLPSIGDGGKPRTTGVLRHISGHSVEGFFDMPLDSTGNKNNVQAIGSSNTYAKRYLIGNLLNIAFADEDDDGNAATPKTPLTDVQQQQIKGLYNRLNQASKDSIFLIHGDMSAVHQEDFNKIHANLQSMLKRQNKAGAVNNG